MFETGNGGELQRMLDIHRAAAAITDLAAHPHVTTLPTLAPEQSTDITAPPTRGRAVTLQPPADKLVSQSTTANDTPSPAAAPIQPPEKPQETVPPEPVQTKDTPQASRPVEPATSKAPTPADPPTQQHAAQAEAERPPEAVSGGGGDKTPPPKPPKPASGAAEPPDDPEEPHDTPIDAPAPSTPDNAPVATPSEDATDPTDVEAQAAAPPTNPPAQSESSVVLDTAERPPTREHPTDLRRLIPAYRAGDPTAERILFQITEAAITQTSRWLSPEVDRAEITSRVHERLFLGDFPFDPEYPLPPDVSPARAPGFIMRRFTRYVGLAVKRIAIDMHYANPEQAAGVVDDVTGELVTGSREAESQEMLYNNVEITPLLGDRILKPVLSEKQLKAVRLRGADKSNAEISELMGIPESAVKSLVARARRNIERHILEDLGLLPLSDFNDRGLYRYIHSGQIQAVQVLGIWYLKEEWVPHNIASDPEYHQISLITTNAEQIAFGRSYPGEIVHYRGKGYIHESAQPLLDTIRARRQATPPRAGAPPDPDYALVPDLAANSMEANAMYRHLKSGGFTGPIRQRRHTYVRRDEAEQFLAEYRAEQERAEQEQAEQERRYNP